jgi:hypothetical protein
MKCLADFGNYLTRCSGWLIWISAFLLAASLIKNAVQGYQHSRSAFALRCDEPVFHLPLAFSGDVVEHTFHVTNVSTRPVQVQKVTPECGCTTISNDLKGRTIRPHESFAVPIKLKITGAEKGDLQKKVVIQFATEPPRNLVLKIAGTVEQRWNWSPETVVFDEIRGGETHSRSVNLQLHPYAPSASITEVATSKYLSASFEPRSSPETNRKMWTITVSLKPPLPPGRHKGVIVVSTSDPLGQLTIPITTIVANNHAQPSSPQFGFIRP